MLNAWLNDTLTALVTAGMSHEAAQEYIDKIDFCMPEVVTSPHQQLEVSPPAAADLAQVWFGHRSVDLCIEPIRCSEAKDFLTTRWDLCSFGTFRTDRRLGWR